MHKSVTAGMAAQHSEYLIPQIHCHSQKYLSLLCVCRVNATKSRKVQWQLPIVTAEK